MQDTRTFRMMAIATVLISMLAATLPAAAAGNQAPGAALIFFVQGNAMVLPPGSAHKVQAKTGMSVDAGAVLTTGANSRLFLIIGGHTTVRLAENTTLALPEAKSSGNLATKLKLVSGRIWVDVNKLTRTQSEVEVETTDVVAAVKGTVFEVTAPGGHYVSTVEVHAGEVAVGSTPVAGGQAVAVNGGAVTSQPYAFDGWSMWNVEGCAQIQVSQMTDFTNQLLTSKDWTKEEIPPELSGIVVKGKVEQAGPEAVKVNVEGMGQAELIPPQWKVLYNGASAAPDQAPAGLDFIAIVPARVMLAGRLPSDQVIKAAVRANTAKNLFKAQPATVVSVDTANHRLSLTTKNAKGLSTPVDVACSGDQAAVLLNAETHCDLAGFREGMAVTLISQGDRPYTVIMNPVSEVAY